MRKWGEHVRDRDEARPARQNNLPGRGGVRIGGQAGGGIRDLWNR